MTCYSNYSNAELEEQLRTNPNNLGAQMEFLARVPDMVKNESDELRRLQQELEKAHVRIAELEELLCQ